MTEKAAYIDCLVLLQTFEAYWGYYSLSDGKIYANASRKSANAFAVSLRELAAQDGQILDPIALQLEEDVDPEGIARRLEEWETNKAVCPFDNMFLSIRKLSPFFRSLKSYIIKKTGITATPLMQVNREELMYREGVTRWQAHMPTMLVMGMESPEELLKKASADQSIVVVGNIKQLQDLMTYAIDRESFSSFIHEFIERTRMLVDEYMGVFDKFTGNGFVAHFSKALCDITNLDMVDCFTNFVRDETTFAADLFDRWGKTVRKLPTDPLGLSIGADTGRVDFQDLVSQLVVVGDPVIWSWRLAGMGSAGDVMINNLLYKIMEDRSDIRAEEREGATKSGETFLAHSIFFQ